VGEKERRDAALELIDIKSPEAMDVLRRAVLSAQDPVVAAVAEAMLVAEVPPESMLEPSVQALRVTTSAALQESLARVMVRYREPGLAAIADAALDQDLPAAERLGPIVALGSFQSRGAAGHLIELLRPHRREPAEIVAAASAGLGRLTGMPQSLTPQRWLDWWAEWRVQSEEEWMRSRIALLSSQNGELTRQLEREQQRATATERRLAQVYRELFPNLTQEAQLAALPALLGDEVAAVRQFAIGRIERFLRDTLIIPEPIQKKLAERLDDPEPALRVAAAKLLEELAYPGIEEQIAQRLDRETSPTVLDGYLKVLAKEPTLSARPDAGALRRGGAVAAHAVRRAARGARRTHVRDAAARPGIIPASGGADPRVRGPGAGRHRRRRAGAGRRARPRRSQREGNRRQRLRAPRPAPAAARPGCR
jgi:hypothetical protein